MADVYVRRRAFVGAGAAALVGLVSYSACGNGTNGDIKTLPGTTKGASSATAPQPTPTPTPSIDTGSLTAALNAALGSRAADVSVAVYDSRVAQTFLYHPELTNVAASIMKVLILASVVRTRRTAGGSLSEAEEGLAENMITLSDNASASALFRRAGRVAGVQKVATSLGMKSTRVNSAWGLTTTTAADQVILMRAIAYGHPLLRADDRADMLELMGDVDDTQRFGIGTLPAGTTGVKVQVKNGWLPYNPGRWHDNSVGHVQGAGRDYTAAVLSTGNATDPAGRALVTKAAAVLYANLGH